MARGFEKREVNNKGGTPKQRTPTGGGRFFNSMVVRVEAPCARRLPRSSITYSGQARFGFDVHKRASFQGVGSNQSDKSKQKGVQSLAHAWNSRNKTRQTSL